MAKKRTAQQEAIREAWNQPQRRWFVSRKIARGPHFWTDYNQLAFGFGDSPYRSSSEYPEDALTVWFRVWPFSLMIFWHLKRILWLGDRQWKKDLKD